MLATGFRQVSPEDKHLEPILAGLFAEYSARYGDYFSHLDEVELTEWYLPPVGIFLQLEQAGEIIATGAFKPFDTQTAEVKRIWTRRDLRGKGIAGKMMRQLERSALAAGYQQIYLTTGFRQPEAVALYRSLGYQPHFDVERDFEEYGLPPYDGRLRFTKSLRHAAKRDVA